MLDISFIVPTYNRAELICACLKPLLAINHVKTETIVVDDHSTDQTASLISELIAQNSTVNLKYLYLPVRRGAQAARNTGYLHSTGQYIMFIDSDDVPIEQGIISLYRQLSLTPSLLCAYGNVQLVDVHLNPLAHHQIGSPFGPSPRFIAGYHWHTMGAMYSRSLLDLVGPWNLTLSGSQDWEYQARVKIATRFISYCPFLVGLWRQHQFSRVGTSEFRKDYTESVVNASLSIFSHCQSANRLGIGLRLRLLFRVLLHSLELGMNGYSGDKRKAIRRSFPFLGIFLLPVLPVIIMLLVFPPPFDRIVYKVLRARVAPLRVV